MKTRKELVDETRQNSLMSDGDIEYETAWNTRVIIELLLDIRDLLNK